MASNRKYIFKTLFNQMITLPILLTVVLGLLFFGGIESIPGEWGEDTVYLSYLLLALIISFFLGGIVGYLYSRLVNDKPQSSKAKYFSAVFPILYTLIFIIMLFIITQGNIRSSGWFWTVVKNPVYFPLGLILFMWGNMAAFVVADLMGYVGFAAGFLLEEIFSKRAREVEGYIQKRKTLKTGLFVLCLGGVLISGALAKDVLYDGYVELRYGQTTLGNDLTEFDLMRIAPFKENNGLAQLDQEASFEFTELESMPRLDGATAAYPVYGAFVEAVYKGLGEYYRENFGDKAKTWTKDAELAFVQSQEYPLNIVQCSKTNRAYERLMAGETDIIFVAEPSQAQKEQIKAQNDEFVLTPIASEAFVFFTNAENSVENLTIQQLQDIYTGKIMNWKEVGGPNRRVLAFQRPENSGSQTVMQNRVMQGQAMMEPSRESYAGGMGEVINRVADYKNAKNSLGYSFLYYSSEMIKNNQIKYLAINGVLPKKESITNGTYPFTVPVYAVTLKSNTNENVGRLIQWIQSEEGQSLIEKTGYIPLGQHGQ